MEKRRSAATIRLEDMDKAAIAAIKAYYGVHSDADAVRIALRELYRTIQRTEKELREGSNNHEQG